jgi:hypothetical protein
MWASNILLAYAADRGIGSAQIPELVSSCRIAEFVVDNYDLLHLYPDDAVFSEIDAEIAEQRS